MNQSYGTKSIESRNETYKKEQFLTFSSFPKGEVTLMVLSLSAGSKHCRGVGERGERPSSFFETVPPINS